MKKINVSTNKFNVLKDIETSFLIFNNDIVYFENLKHEVVTEKNFFGKSVENIYITGIDLCRYSVEDSKEYLLGESSINYFLGCTANELNDTRRDFIKFRRQLEGMGYHIIKNGSLDTIE